MMSRTQPRKKDRKAYQGEYPGKFNQWIRRLRLGPPIRMGAAQVLSSERGKSCVPLPYCFSVFCFLASFCFPGLSEAEGWKVEFPDVPPLPCPLLYRGCGRKHLGNGIHHLMRSFHPSDTNIVWGSIFLPPRRKKFRKFLGPILKAPPNSFQRKEPALRSMLWGQ